MRTLAPAGNEGQYRKDEFLFIGCDVGKNKHAIAIVNRSGKVLQEIPEIYNSRKGFDYLLRRINYWKEKTGAKKIIFAFEPTGHYWKPVFNYIRNQGIEVRFIKTTAVKAMRELTDSTPSKNDKRDALTLAHLLREGKVLKGGPLEGVWRELRDTITYRDKLTEEFKAYTQRLGAIIETFFPELVEVFPNMRAVGFWKYLEVAPFPEELIEAGEEWLEEHLKRWTRKGKSPREKAESLMEAARNTIGIPSAAGDRVRLSSILVLLRTCKEEIHRVESEMKRALMETGYGEILLSFPGIGVISAAIFLGELGNPENFENAGQVVSFMGIDPSEKSSGNKKSRNKISKKGRPVMRTNAYYMAMSGILHCPELRDYHLRRKKDIKAGLLDLVPMQLLFAVAVKQTRMIFAMCRDKQLYRENYLENRIAA